MTKIYTINLDDKILNGKANNKKRVLFIDKNKAKTISGIIDYFMEENEIGINGCASIENNKQAGIIIPKKGTKVRYDLSKIGPSIIITFDKTNGKNKNLRIYENEWGDDYRLEEVMKYTIKKGEFVKLKTIPKEFVRYIY